MYTSEELKQSYWNYFTDKTKFKRPFGCTDKRLEKIKSEIFNDKSFWDDVVWRHGCEKYTNPEDYKANISSETFEHCLGNFFGMIMQTLTRNNMLKSQTNPNKYRWKKLE
jgi:hypothetical protein